MNFTEAVDEVKETVKRPDLVGRIRREVNNAITFYSLDGEWPRDYTEQTIALNNTQYQQAFAISSMTRFRKFKYLRRAPKKFLTEVSREDIANGCYTLDRYYIVGTNVNLSLAALTSNLDVGYYSYPPLLTDASPTHWMLDHSPYMIIDRAISAIFKSVGEEKSFQLHRGASAESYAAFRKDILKTGT